jgi:NUBPL iron-transfer P-loop NTPase
VLFCPDCRCFLCICITYCLLVGITDVLSAWKHSLEDRLDRLNVCWGVGWIPVRDPVHGIDLISVAFLLASTKYVGLLLWYRSPTAFTFHQSCLIMPTLHSLTHSLTHSRGSDAVIWRGPRKTDLVKRMLAETYWGKKDFLVLACLCVRLSLSLFCVVQSMLLCK